MGMSDIPALGLLKERMHWQVARQKYLAENVANADVPNFKPQDLRDPNAGDELKSINLTRTSAAHLGPTGAMEGDANDARRFETTPSGNSVVLEDEMMKAAGNQGDYQLAAVLYTKSLNLIKTASGRR